MFVATLVFGAGETGVGDDTALLGAMSTVGRVSAEYCTVSGPGLKVYLSASNYSAGVPANDRMSATLSMSS